MPRSLLIAVQFQEGRYHGQEDGFDGANGWPPSPGRLFQAFVAAAARGAWIAAEDECALKWLERLDPPKIAAPAVRRGRSVKLYVPNNDLDSVGGDPARVSEIRVPKQWRPCFFDPQEPVIYVWDFEAGSENAARICAIAARLYQLGRGIDMAWASGQILERNDAESVLEAHPGPIRRSGGTGETATPHFGTFDSLVERYRRKRSRLTTVGAGRKSRQLFTQPPKASFRRTGYDTPPRCLHFDLRQPEGGFAPQPLASVGPLMVGLRDVAAGRLREFLPDKSALFERLIIGRGAGSSDLAQRIRLIPIPSIGTVHTDPSIRRIVVEVPPDCPIRVDDLKWAFSGIEPHDPRTGENWPGRLVSAEDTRMADRFAGPARVFRSVTPIALSRQRRRRLGPNDKKSAGERNLEERRASGAVVQALRHAGVRVSPVDVRVQREPFNSRGERAEAFAAGTRFPKEALWHAAITFAEPLAGPLLLGDGRYLGLGLMLPDEPIPGVLAFAIEEGLTDVADPVIVAHAARRAMMARVQASLPRGQTLPLYVSGHEDGGGPARGDGHHRHIVVVADLPRRRLLYIAPNLLLRRRVRWLDVKQHQRLTERALEGMDVLRAGKAGKLMLAPTTLNANTDPLFAPVRIWESVTDYRVTRHRRQLTEEEALKTNVLAELRRAGWPTPEDIHVLSVRPGPRGGLSGRLRIAFAVAQGGPLLLGRTAHKGGGLFADAT